MKTEVEQELLDRARRTESRLVTLGQALNVDLMDLARQQKATYAYDAIRGHHVTILSLDVPVARIMKAVKDAGQAGHVAVYFEGRLIAAVTV